MNQHSSDPGSFLVTSLPVPRRFGFPRMLLKPLGAKATIWFRSEQKSCACEGGEKGGGSSADFGVSAAPFCNWADRVNALLAAAASPLLACTSPSSFQPSTLSAGLSFSVRA